MREHGCGQMRVFCAQTEPNVVAACYSSAPARSVSPVAFPTAAWCSRCESPVLALSVVCGLGKSRLISGVYSEQFELSSSPFDGFKKGQNPESTNYR